MQSFFIFLGKPMINFFVLIDAFGKFIIFNLSLIPLMFERPYRVREIFKEIENIGVNSFWVISLTAIFTGLVQAVQLYHGFHQFGAESFMGYVIFISITKELAPVLGGLMIISRSVSSMAAEIGTMRVTEQIDAIDTLGVDSKKYLIIPKIIATTISLPILIIYFDFLGNYSAYLIATNVLGVNEVIYQDTIVALLKFSDIGSGLIKALIFGYAISSIGTYVGYFTTGGAKGVGMATTNSVVKAAVTIFVLNYIISSVFLFLDW